MAATLTLGHVEAEDWPVSGLRIKNLNSPDSILEDARMHADVVEIGDVTVYREVDQPGWRWSTHHRDMVGTEWCEARHQGVVISGRFGSVARRDDGRVRSRRCLRDPSRTRLLDDRHRTRVVIEWTGFGAWSPPPGGVHARVLTTLLFTDLVDSTATLVRLGDAAWRDALWRTTKRRG